MIALFLFYSPIPPGILTKEFDSSCLISGSSSKAERKQLLSRMVDMYTDAYFKVGTLDTAQLVASNNVPVFQYRSGIITRAL